MNNDTRSFYQEFEDFKKTYKPGPPPEAIPEKRSTLGEVFSQLKAGAFSDLPRFEQKAKAIQSMGTGDLENVRESYFPHIWKKSEDASKEINTRLSKRPLEGSKSFSKSRVFDDILTGIEAGFDLVSTNPIDLVILKMAEQDKYINAHLALQAMEKSGLVELIPAGDKMTDGYGDISGKYGLVTKRAHQDAAKEMPQVVEWLTMAGARRIMDSRFQTTTTQNMLQAWSDGNKIGAGVRLIPSIVEQSARPIMEWLVPRQKLGVFTEMAHDWNNSNPNASHEETRKAMQQIWNRVDSRLGQVVYDRLFVHNVAKNLTRALIRAPGWTGGTILEVGGGLKDLTTFAMDTAKGKKPELSDRSAYTLSLLVTTAIANTVLTALFTGEPPKDWKDLLAFRTGRKDEKGNPERFMLPTYAKDVYAYAMKPGTTLLHKSHPMISLVGDLIRNKDYYGVEIRHEGDNPIIQLAQAGKFTAKAFVPFWMKGAAKDLERGGNLITMAAPLIGIMPAPANLNQSKAEQLASELVRARMPQGTKTAEEFERSQIVQHLSGLARRDPAQARKEMQEALKERKITPLQARHVFATIGYARVSTQEQELTAQFEQLNTVKVDKLFQEKASGVKQDRPQLAAMIEYAREGDTVVVCKLDRIARSTKHLLEIVEALEAKKVAFKVLNINLDTATPTGKLMLSMLAAIGQFEREMMLERQREGIRLAKAAGAYKGRKPTARAQAAGVMELIGQGKTKQATADELGIGVASVYRILKSGKTV